jgi:hypothetical protein
MGSPVNQPKFSQFGASGTPGYIIPTADCDETKVRQGSPYSTVLGMDESSAGARTCTSAQWIAEDANATAQNAVGYAVARYGAGTLKVSGAPNLNSSYTVSGLGNSNWTNTTKQNHTVKSGWHLVSNPYQAVVELSSIDQTVFDNQIQVWNADGPTSGSYQPATIGVNAVLAPFQAFMIHVKPGQSGNFVINASDRKRSVQRFYRQNNNSQLDITATNDNSGLIDKTTVGFNTEATDQFDPVYDANKPSGLLNRHTLYTLNNNEWMSINVLNSIQNTTSVPMGFEPGQTGSYTLTFNNLNSFDATSYIYLEDKNNNSNNWYNVRNGDYHFTADSADDWNRFVLHFTPAASISITDGSCSNKGWIRAEQPGTASWAYTITDANNQVISSGRLDQSTPLAVEAAMGDYTLTLTDNNNYTVTKTITVGGTTNPVSGFTVSANNTMVHQAVMFNNTSVGATNYNWNFGDGTSVSGMDNTSHSYTTAGVYTVVLTASTPGGCNSVSSQEITVTDNTATGIRNINDLSSLGIWSHENKVYVDLSGLHEAEGRVVIYDVLGQEISNERATGGAIYQKEINNISAAYMLVTVKIGDRIKTRKVFIENK